MLKATLRDKKRQLHQIKSTILAIEQKLKESRTDKVV